MRLWSMLGGVLLCGSACLAFAAPQVARPITGPMPSPWICTPLGCTFIGAQDNAIVQVGVVNQGLHEGATPDGYAEVYVQAQDEVHDASGAVRCDRPPCSSNITGRFRVMSQQFNQNHGCRGTQCPAMTEVYSDHDVRLTAADHGVISLNAYDLRTGSATPTPLCIDQGGVLVLCR